ncbi:hypothetical protein Tco_0655705 [Tanacetum coccineum]|uniref:Uncharacterized protein n=1 Tax=Tanacetum coccineum TaxID=301880 RepID=A0ABQ4X6W0_9ASTR
MADLEFVDQHNMVACLEKTGGNSEFHEIVDFLTSSLIHHALTAVVINNEVASIRSSLLLHDADGTACLTNEAIFQNLALMGYEGELNKLTFQKALFSPQWKYLIHTILHCLSSKSTSWNEFSTNIASAFAMDTTQDSRDSLEDTNEGTQVQSSYDSPLSGDHTSEKAEGGLNLEELFVLCTNLFNRVLALETSKGCSDAFDDLMLDGRDYMENIGCCNRREDKVMKLGSLPGLSGEKKRCTEELILKVLLDMARSILTLKPLSTIDPKDKSKSVLEEPEPAKKMTRSDFDAQMAKEMQKIALG